MRDYFRGVGYFLALLGLIGLIGRHVVTLFGIGVGREGQELQLLSYTVAAIGNLIAGYILIRLTQKSSEVSKGV